MSWLRGLVLSHWERKISSLFLAILIWLAVNHSLTTTEVLENIPVRLINLSAGITVEGLQPNGILSKKISLSLQGNKKQIAEITSSDIEIVLDAMDKSGDWMAPISRKNLNCLNPAIDLSRAIKKVAAQQLHIAFTRLVTEKIHILVTNPLGEAPRGYQFLDVWPCHLNMTVSGPEEVVRTIKAKGINLTFNMSEIPRNTLEDQEAASDAIAFFVPDDWKQIVIPSLSDRPFEIDDPQARELRIDFIRNDLHPITKPLPITLFFTPEHSSALNPEKFSLATGNIIQQFNGLYLLRQSLYAKGVSRLFVELVQDMLEITILLTPKPHKTSLEWSLQFLNPRVLEDRYVSTLMSDDQDMSEDPFLVKKREDHLRERFRRYMNQFQLYKSEQEKLDLMVDVKGNKVIVQEKIP